MWEAMRICKALPDARILSADGGDQRAGDRPAGLPGADLDELHSGRKEPHCIAFVRVCPWKYGAAELAVL